MDAMTTETIVMIIAILAGPICAVVLTRWLDERRVKSARRWDIFRDLMRYRGDSINANFVGELNLLEVEFSDDERVTGAWKTLRRTKRCSA